MDLTEIWKPVSESGYEDLYEVSSLGRVRGVARTIQASNRVLNYPRRTLKQNLDSRCYPQVVLCKETRRKTKSVHRLVMETFVGPCPKGMEVLHINGVAYDCRLENLRYGTHSENVIEAIDLGRHNRSPEYTQIDWKQYREESKRLLNQRLKELEDTEEDGWN